MTERVKKKKASRKGKPKTSLCTDGWARLLQEFCMSPRDFFKRVTWLSAPNREDLFANEYC